MILIATPITRAAENKRVLVLDSGHDASLHGEPAKVGAIGTCGEPEVKYNDDATSVVAEKFAADANYKLVLTRKAGQNVDLSGLSKETIKKSLAPSTYSHLEGSKTLLGRAAIANAAGCDAFISIHHDSTITKFQEGTPVCHVDSITGKTTGGVHLTQAFKDKYKIGFSVLVYEDDPDTKRVEESNKLAAFIAARLKKRLTTNSVKLSWSRRRLFKLQRRNRLSGRQCTNGHHP